MRVVLVLALAILAIGATSCAEEPTDAPEQQSVAEKMAAIDGDASASDFQGKLDCLTASGAPGTETEEDVANTLAAGWEESGKSESLWAFTTALASFYDC